MPLGIAIEDNLRASLCCHTLENARKSYPDIAGCIIHSDRGSQYTSAEYREVIGKYGILQSMNSDGGRCHDNARCESMWARMKEELFYNRGDKSENYTISELKTMIWRYYMSYWTNKRICSANGGLPPAVKRLRYYESLNIAAWNLFEINVSSIIDNFKYQANVNTLIGSMRDRLAYAVFSRNPAHRQKKLERILIEVKKSVVPIRPDDGNTPRYENTRKSLHHHNKRHNLWCS